MKTRVKTALKALFGLLLLAVLIWKVEWAETMAVLANISVPWIAALLMISFVLVWISCVKWRLFLSARGATVSLWSLQELYLIGYFFNNFAPGSVGGDVVRSYILGAHIKSQAGSFGTVFLERFTGMVALMGMALVAAFIRPEFLANRVLFFLLALMAAGLGFVLFLLTSAWAQQQAKRLFARFPRGSFATSIGKVMDVVFYFRDHHGILLRAMGLSILFHVATIVNTQAACLALGLEVRFLDLAVLVPVVLAVAAIPVSMNALGIMEGAFVYFLALAGLGPAEALSVALILRAKNILLALLGGLLFLRWSDVVKTGRSAHA